MSLCGAGPPLRAPGSEHPTAPPGYQTWLAPQCSSSSPSHDSILYVFNSLTNTKTPFVPMNGRVVKWYTCGPTVYDVCHMGHARAYLTFDILRRIMQDYFHYDVQYHVNITDVDDKIIIRARRNKLVQDYISSKPTLQDLFDRVMAAVTTSTNKLQADLTNTTKQLQDPGARVDELKEHLEQVKLKIDKLTTTSTTLSTIRQSTSIPDATKYDQVLALAGDELGQSLDSTRSVDMLFDNAIFDAHARKFERSFMVDMKRLGVRLPDVLTRVTEYIPAIVLYIQKIVDKGLAYVSPSGSVYLSIQAFRASGHTYRKLRPSTGATSELELAESEGALGLGATMAEKKDPSDFVLWKASKPGEPRWSSPWGDGRPGWHIECSVVASDVLGDNIDVHAGGEDLKFPHHDNELAQSEAHFGCKQWVNYFFHAGHLQIKGLKMSKSLKNFVTIEECLKEWTPRQLRILFLLQPWNGNFTYSEDGMKEARDKERRIIAFLGSVQALGREDWLGTVIGAPSQGERDFATIVVRAKAEFHTALLDNFDTKRAMDALESIITGFYAYCETTKRPAVLVCTSASRFVTESFRVFGAEFGNNSGGSGADNSGTLEDIVAPYLDALVEFREKVRVAGAGAGNLAILKACDELRDDTLVDRGVVLEDRSFMGLPPIWKLRDVEELRREVAQQKLKIAKEKEEKILRKKQMLEKEIEKIQSILTAGPDMDYRVMTNLYSEWDGEGIPVKDVQGMEIPKTTRKKLLEQATKRSTDWKKMEESAKKEGVNSILELLNKKKSELENGGNSSVTVAVSGTYSVNGQEFPTNIHVLKGKKFSDVGEYVRFLHDHGKHVLDVIPRPPRNPVKALALAVALWMLREATFPLREKSVKGKVVLITGGGSGIGRLLGLKLAKDGATVILWDINLDAAQNVANEIKTMGGKAGAYKVDVADRNVVYAVAAQTLKDWNRVDILINNAGIVEGKKLFEADDARQEQTIKINTIALLWVTKSFLPGMIQRKEGHVVTIASSAGRVGVNGMVAYCASKFGAVGFDESLRGELRNVCPEVKTTCVCPGYINTGMFSGAKMRSTIPAMQPVVDTLMPVLEPDYVVSKIVTAIKRNQTILVMPRFGYLSYLFRAITPTSLLDVAMDVLGVSRSMEKFEQTRV